MAKDQSDTLGVAIQDYVRRRLTDTFYRTPRSSTDQHKPVAAFALATDALRRTDQARRGPLTHV